jgi:polysaccharide biosynthesis/export protein
LLSGAIDGNFSAYGGFSDMSFAKFRRCQPTGLRRAARALLVQCIFLSCANFGAAGHAQGADAGTVPRIGKGDVLRIDVIGRPDLSGRFTVEADGSVTLPVVGSISVVGRTASEATADLSRRFGLMDRDILRVNVVIVESESQRVFVLGAVLRPGPYTFLEPPNAWDAIVQAGGTTEDAALSSVEIISGDQKGDRGVTVVDVESALSGGRLNSLERLHPGDTVRVPRSQGLGSSQGGNLVYVFGAVATQGSLPITTSLDLVTAVIRSGGPLPDANLKQVEVVRRNGENLSRFRINMRSYTESGAPSGNLALRSGDTVFVPRFTNHPSPVLSILGTLSPFVALAASVASIAALSRH